jgi:hypothetical protein
METIGIVAWAVFFLAMSYNLFLFFRIRKIKRMNDKLEAGIPLTEDEQRLSDKILAKHRKML